MSAPEIAAYIDHTLLKPVASRKQIEQLCREADEHAFAAVCINPYWVPLAKATLRNSQSKVCTVVGFPLGANPSQVKLAEAEWCLNQGADELDMVMNIGEAKAGNWPAVQDEISALAQLVHRHNAILKVILENCLLEKTEIVTACRICLEAKADFVKTSTGFADGGATPEDVSLMVETVAGKCQVKAAGGVRNAEQARAMINLGASRIGTSAGVTIVSGGQADGGY